MQRLFVVEENEEKLSTGIMAKPRIGKNSARLSQCEISSIIAQIEIFEARINWSWSKLSPSVPELRRIWSCPQFSHH